MTRTSSRSPTLKGLRPALFERRLLIVVGKGGVGKTTVSCILAWLAAQSGKKALIAEVDGAGRAARLLGVEPAPTGQARGVRPGLSVMSVEGSAALAEYLQIIFPIKRVLQAVFSSQIYQYFVAAAPGLKELMTIGKIWYEADRLDENGKPMWDLVVLDAPATGHSLQYLGMPRAAHDMFRAGLVGRESQRLIELLTDPQRTAVNLVTTAEEMPVNETLEMYQRLQNELEMPLGYLFVNRVHRASFDDAAIEKLATVVEQARDTRERTLLTEALARAREECGWTAINATYLERLREAIDMPQLELPYVFTEEFGADEVRTLALDLERSAHELTSRGVKRGRA